MGTITAIRQPPRKARGFTLIEMVIVVAIVIILASVGIPSMRSFIASQRIKTASFDMIAMLTITRSEAIKRNANVTSTPNNSDWTQGWVVQAPLSGGGTITVSQQGAMQGSDITITCLTSSGSPQTCAPIVYNSSGRAPGSAQNIQIISSSVAPGQNARCIMIDMSGRPMSKKGTC